MFYKGKYLIFIIPCKRHKVPLIKGWRHGVRRVGGSFNNVLSRPVGEDLFSEPYDIGVRGAKIWGVFHFMRSQETASLVYGGGSLMI